jgi:hypothetical protein
VIMFWNWLLKYSSLLVTAFLSLIVGWVLHVLTTRRADLIHYLGHEQWVRTTPPDQPPQMVGTVTLFIFNQGKAPAKNVYVGHAWLPAHSIYPDIPSQISDLPGGGKAIHFPVVPSRTLISISYLLFPPANTGSFLQYVGSEDGAAKRIPVMLQRVWPNWFNRTALMLMLGGIWVAINIVVSLVVFLWKAYR